MYKKLKIFFGDDDFINRNIVIEHVKRFGIEIIGFETGRNLISEIENNIPDLVLIDCYMPEMSGYQVADYISDLKKEKKIPKNLPVIAVSTDSSEQNYARIKICGFCDLIEKPLDDQKLIQIFKKWLDLNIKEEKLTMLEKNFNKDIHYRFYQRLKLYLQEIPKILEDSSKINKIELEKLARIIYNCIGTPEILGFHEISNLAIALNEEIFKILNSEIISPIDINKIDNLATILLEEINSIIKNKKKIKTKLINKLELTDNFLNILLIEDDIILSDLIKANLEINHNRVINCNSSKELDIILKNEKLDLIIIDINFSNFDSLAIIRKIKESTNYQHIPIIILTAKHDNKKIIDIVHLGASDFIHKPFNVVDLLNRINNVTTKNKVKILIIDEDQFLLAFLKDKLEQENYNVITTNNNKFALKLAKKNKPDLIILEKMMFKVNSNKIIKSLQEDEETADIPIIFLTTKASDNNIHQEDDLTVYIYKPFKISNLNKKIISLLYKRNQF